MKDIMSMGREARTYVLMRDAGADHGSALRKACRGNWNPYAQAQPVVTAEREAEVEALLIAEGVFTR